MRILIVEDDEVVQGVLKAYLLHYGAAHQDPVDVQMMPDARRAMDLLTTGDDICDVLFLDVRMPGLGGDEIYTTLMRVKPQMLGRIVFVTGYRDDLVARFPALKLNILDKPFRYRQLLEAMAAIA
ncbi:MAG: response regulator [Mariprofundaceae bacterium]|nr:response regulator [Mariprofundaceae bacterium]